MVDPIHVRGLAELNRELAAFPTKIKKKAVRRAIAAGAKIVQKDAKASAPRRTGATRRAIATKSTPSRSRPDRVRSSVFIRTSGNRTKAARARNEDPFYWYFQEFGYRATGRGAKTSGLSRADFRARGRKIPGKRFMQRAFNRNTGRILVTFRSTLKREIDTYNASRS